MSHFLKTISIIVFISGMIAFSSFAEKRNLDSRYINIAGLVVNAETLLPVADAKIYDINNTLLGSTDKNGYFDIKIDFLKSGDITFKLKITSVGYQTFTEYDHWGDLKTGAKKVMYFGLKHSKSKADSFSSFGGGGNLAYEDVLKGFTKVNAEKEFNDKLSAAKSGNENTLVKIDDQYYIVDTGGWIKLNSDKDSIYLNNKDLVIADKLNITIKRNKIKGMSPLNTKPVKFVIYTR